MSEQDQMIIAQKEALDKEIAEKIPLVGKLEDIGVLATELANDETFFNKAKSLESIYSNIRRTRPDGNCFFRAIGFRYFEVLMKDPKERKRFREDVVAPSKDQMIEVGFPSFTTEDFHENFLETLDQLGSEKYTDESLYETFAEQGTSDYLVVFLRMLTSMHLKKNAEFFQNFLDNGKTVQEFCDTEVEPMFQESDNIHVTALTAATQIRVRIMYLDRGSNKEASPHDFLEDAGPPQVHLLYRPGHYDILYPK